MNNDGMQLLNDYYDKNSNFYQHAQPEIIANEFYADPNKLKKLYHYTSYEAFERILSSSTFLIGSIHYMNDNKEIKYVYELMKKELKLLGAPNDIILKLEELNTILGSVAKLKLYAHLYKTIKANIVLTVKSFVSINYFSFFSINIT